MKRLAMGIGILFLSLLLAACGAAATPTGASPSSAPIPTGTPDSVVCDDGFGIAFAWEDLDSDGQFDENEPPLSGVCVTSYAASTGDETPDERCYKDDSPKELYTDQAGMWRTPYMMGSCGTAEENSTAIAEQCNAHVTVASPPKGYVATTEMVSSGCGAHFGITIRTASATPSFCLRSRS